MVERILESYHIRTLLWEELKGVGLIIDSGRYRACLARVCDLGTDERCRLSFLDSHEWREANSTLERPCSESDLVRVLGFGRLLTEFVIAPSSTRITIPALEEVLELGTLTNLIVTIYDHYVDLLPSGTPILPYWVLEYARLGRLHRGLVGQSTAQMCVVIHFITRYFERLTSLPYVRQHSSILDCVYRSIVSMYHAEVATRRRDDEASPDWILRRKSALPFVVMGLPVWLALPEVPASTFLNHLRWLYRLGEFVGWIDDIIDLDADHQAGHPNRLHNALARVSDPEGYQGELIRHIAGRGEQLVSQWRGWGAESGPLSLSGADTLSAVIISWFGGSAPGN